MTVPTAAIFGVGHIRDCNVRIHEVARGDQDGKMQSQNSHMWITAFFQSNAVFSTLLLTLLIVYFGSERSVLHVR